MAIEFCIRADELRVALAEIELAERNGFDHCLAIFQLKNAGRDIGECLAAYSDLSERAHPTNREYNWGRYQGVTKRHRFENGKLIPLSAPPLKSAKGE